MRLESDIQKLGLGLISIGNHCKLSSCMTWLDLRLKIKEWREEGRKVGCHCVETGIKEVTVNERVQLRSQCQAFPSEITEGWRRGDL